MNAADASALLQTSDERGVRAETSHGDSDRSIRFLSLLATETKRPVRSNKIRHVARACICYKMCDGAVCDIAGEAKDACLEAACT